MSDQLETVADELCAVFAEERHAIAALDHTRIDELAVCKHALAGELAALCKADGTSRVRQFIERIRVEASATALLASTATSAIRAALGQESAGYDRRARIMTSQLQHIHVTY
jgi:hypothetical protein